MPNPLTIPKMPGVAMRPVRFTDGPPVEGGHKVIHLPNWGKMGDKGRVAFINKMIKSYGRDPRLRQVALSIIRQAGVQPRDYKGQASALLKWVNQNIYYINEPGEQLQSVWYTLRTKSGDCDDTHILLCSLAESVRLPWKTVLSGRVRATGQRVRWISGSPFPKGVKFSHIYSLLGWPPFRPQEWTFADPSLKNAYLGWDIVGAKQMRPVPGAPADLMPEMGVGDFGDFGSAISRANQRSQSFDCPTGYTRVTGISPLTKRAVSACIPSVLASQRKADTNIEIEQKVAEAEKKAFWRTIDWKDVVTVALPTIISGMTLAYLSRRK